MAALAVSALLGTILVPLELCCKDVVGHFAEKGILTKPFVQGAQFVHNRNNHRRADLRSLAGIRRAGSTMARAARDQTAGLSCQAGVIPKQHQHLFAPRPGPAPPPHHSHKRQSDRHLAHWASCHKTEVHATRVRRAHPVAGKGGCRSGSFLSTASSRPPERLVLVTPGFSIGG